MNSPQAILGYVRDQLEGLATPQVVCDHLPRWHHQLLSRTIDSGLASTQTQHARRSLGSIWNDPMLRSGAWRPGILHDARRAAGVRTFIALAHALGDVLQEDRFASLCHATEEAVWIPMWAIAAMARRVDLYDGRELRKEADGDLADLPLDGPTEQVALAWVSWLNGGTQTTTAFVTSSVVWTWAPVMAVSLAPPTSANGLVHREMNDRRRALALVRRAYLSRKSSLVPLRRGPESAVVFPILPWRAAGDAVPARATIEQDPYWSRFVPEVDAVFQATSPADLSRRLQNVPLVARWLFLVGEEARSPADALRQLLFDWLLIIVVRGAVVDGDGIPVWRLSGSAEEEPVYVVQTGAGMWITASIIPRILATLGVLPPAGFRSGVQWSSCDWEYLVCQGGWRPAFLATIWPGLARLRESPQMYAAGWLPIPETVVHPALRQRLPTADVHFDAVGQRS